MTYLVDNFGRRLDYLRVSLTDRCNFRCLYCMPPEGIPLLSRENILRIEEIERLIRILVSLGIKRVRLTGGEPLLRKKIVSLVASLARIENLSEVALTTNGSMLAPLAGPLKEAGLSCVNISLDSLNQNRFKKITLRDQLKEVLQGITKALEASLKVKINVVALGDMTQSEVESFCRLACTYPVEVRFIEFMPLCGTGWRPELALSMSTLKGWVHEAFDLSRLPRNNQVAESFEIKGAPGRIGFIASLSEPFCAKCNRLRLTAEGKLKPCLFSHAETDLKTPLRRGDSDEEIAKIICNAAQDKPKGHEMLRNSMDETSLPKIRSLGG